MVLKASTVSTSVTMVYWSRDRSRHGCSDGPSVSAPSRPIRCSRRQIQPASTCTGSDAPAPYHNHRFILRITRSATVERVFRRHDAALCAPRPIHHGEPSRSMEKRSGEASTISMIVRQPRCCTRSTSDRSGTDAACRHRGKDQRDPCRAGRARRVSAIPAFSQSCCSSAMPAKNTLHGRRTGASSRHHSTDG